MEMNEGIREMMNEKKYLAASELTQSFILLRLIKWVPETPGDSVGLSNLSHCGGPEVLK